MTILTTIQNFSRRTNVAVPATVNGSTDPQVLQMLSILEEEGNDLSGRGDWQELTYEALHTTVATESQGNINTIATNGFRYIKNNTIWNRDTTIPIYVVNGTEWQALKAIPATGPNYQVRIRGDELISNPIPVVGDTWAFEYVSWNWLKNGSTFKQYSTDDADVIILPEVIILAGLRWRWKKEKGFDYAEDYETYEKLISDALARSGIRRTIYMNEGKRAASPKIVVSPGDWPV